MSESNSSSLGADLEDDAVAGGEDLMREDDAVADANDDVVDDDAVVADPSTVALPPPFLDHAGIPVEFWKRFAVARAVKDPVSGHHSKRFCCIDGEIDFALTFCEFCCENDFSFCRQQSR